MQFKIRRYARWTYDIWGNTHEIYDRYSQGCVTIKCKRAVYNAGTPQEFETFEPTDRQLSRAFGCAGCAWNGQDGWYTAELRSNGRPMGALDEEERPERCSHEIPTLIQLHVTSCTAVGAGLNGKALDVGLRAAGWLDPVVLCRVVHVRERCYRNGREVYPPKSE